jgi:catechol 2,3-dioxygenase-like lactoylglutathione lyase family enzyme
MKFRYARHTNNFKALTSFYTNVIGLEVLASFENHDNYNGVFLGKPNMDWHIEFTESDEKADHHPDEDDLLVFYLSEEELEKVKANIEKCNLTIVKSKNPYWQKHGIEIKDPDGFGVVLSLVK